MIQVYLCLILKTLKALIGFQGPVGTCGISLLKTLGKKARVFPKISNCSFKVVIIHNGIIRKVFCFLKSINILKDSTPSSFF